MVPGVNPTAPEHQTSPRFPPPSYSTSQRRHSEMALLTSTWLRPNIGVKTEWLGPRREITRDKKHLTLPSGNLTVCY